MHAQAWLLNLLALCLRFDSRFVFTRSSCIFSTERPNPTRFCHSCMNVMTHCSFAVLTDWSYYFFPSPSFDKHVQLLHCNVHSHTLFIRMPVSSRSFSTKANKEIAPLFLSFVPGLSVRFPFLFLNGMKTLLFQTPQTG